MTKYPDTITINGVAQPRNAANLHAASFEAYQSNNALLGRSLAHEARELERDAETFILALGDPQRATRAQVEAERQIQAPFLNITAGDPPKRKSTYKPQIGAAPWHCDLAAFDPTSLDVRDKHGKIICRLPGVLPLDYAHGAMIEALPDLMAALQGLMEWGRVHTGPLMPNSPHALLVAAQAALQKAGREQVTLAPYLSLDPHRPFVPDPVLERVTDPQILRRINNECRIVLDVARHAVARGLWLWVDYDDGEKRAWTQDLNTIRNRLHACDEETLMLATRGEDGKFKRAGAFFLVYGNAPDGTEVLSDWSVNEDTEALDALVQPLLRQLEREG